MLSRSERNTVEELVSSYIRRRLRELTTRKGQSRYVYAIKQFPNWAYRREVNYMMKKRDFKRGFFA